MKHIIAALMLLSCAGMLRAQTTNPDLAMAGDFYDRAQWEQAIEAFDRAAVDESLSDGELHKLAYALLQLDRYERARIVLESVTARNPRAYVAWYNLGIAHMNCGRFPTGRDCLRRVTELEPLWARGWFSLGLCQLMTGQLDLAWESLGFLSPLDTDMAAELLEAIQAEEAYVNDPAEQ
ncbi:MAG: tetratricopeptide repeat protein [Bacteroidia bacterium]|nr:tetratricopeptide repeat protein [Bacteroidia bacterium]